jgi:predicted ATP-binding protein involved in virulence
MNYWHIQLCPSDIELKKEFLGFKNNEKYKRLINQIENNINLNDIILIKDKSTLIALVEIIGKYESNNDEYGRKIKILDSQTKTMDGYPLGGDKVEFKQITEKDTSVYPYIKKWHKGQKDSLISAYKLKKLHIKNYKLFNDLNINFSDNENNPLPVIIIAGINGSGKTTLLEYINNSCNNIGLFGGSLEMQFKNQNFIVNRENVKKYFNFKMRNEENVKQQHLQGNEIAVTFIPDDLENIYSFCDDKKSKITYIPTLKDNVEDIKKFILERHRKRSRQLDSIKNATKEIEDSIKKIFDGIDLSFSLIDVNDVERDNEKIIFRNKNGKEFDINDLSTGEKTLLSKVLYLYFKDIKNQIILIDEPELSLHPAWQNRVLKLYENFAKENNCQIIIATHSPHILGSAKSESVRLLTEDGVVDNFSHTYGAKFSQILTDIMGVRDLRTPEINEKFTLIEDMIVENQFNTEKFHKKWQELEDILGKNYFDLKLLKLEIASRRKDVQNK